MRRADHSLRGLRPSVVFLSVCDLAALTVKPRPTGAVQRWEGGGHFAKVQTLDI